jgi:acyl dehydratase
MTGAALSSRVLPPVTRSDIVRYQGASGDFDAAHHDDAHAQSYGYPGVFSLGMLHAAQLARFATDQFGAERLRRFAVRFKGVVWPGDVLTLSGTVLEETDTAITLDLAATNGEGRAVLLASAVFAK